MTFRNIAFCALGVGVALSAPFAPALAQENLAEELFAEEYQFQNPALIAIDGGCRMMARRSLSRSVSGLTALEFRRPNVWESALEGVAIFSYSGMSFKSEFGDAIGGVTCVVATKKKTIAEVAFTFEGIGLAGFPSSDETVQPSDNFRGFVVVKNPSLTGAKEEE